MPTLIDGKLVAQTLRKKFADEVEALKKQGITPGLAVILVGNDSASAVYVRNKKKACAETGIASLCYELPEDTSKEELLALIEELNGREDVDGILVQLPLPGGIDKSEIINAISPEKDVDAFNVSNVGKIAVGEKGFVPCTPAGVMELFKFYNVDLTGKNCVIVGRSNIVGKPMALLCTAADATVTLCHSKTVGLSEITKRADVLISTVGKAKFITADMVKDGAVVIDVGINRDENRKLCGDVDFENVSKKASLISPVPGGVGPMTITMLLQNTITSAKKRGNIQ